jgi:hypothetical protein
MISTLIVKRSKSNIQKSGIKQQLAGVLLMAKGRMKQLEVAIYRGTCH